MWILCASPLFDFWLDEEPWEEDFQQIASTALVVGYTLDDVRAIYWREVVPAIMGTWMPMDPVSPVWLEQRIQQRPRLGYWFSWLLTPWWGWAAWVYWRRIVRWMKEV